MAKFSKRAKLSPQEQRKLLVEFCDAITAIKTRGEAADFIQDLLSRQEVEMLAKRIQIANLLLDGWHYPKIQGTLKVSAGTIARVSAWLQESGQGFRLVKSRVKPYDESRKDPLEAYQNHRKRFRGYHWPELLLEALGERSKKKQQQRLNQILANLDRKSHIYKQIQFLL